AIVLVNCGERRGYVDPVSAPAPETDRGELSVRVVAGGNVDSCAAADLGGDPFQARVQPRTLLGRPVFFRLLWFLRWRGRRLLVFLRVGLWLRAIVQVFARLSLFLRRASRPRPVWRSHSVVSDPRRPQLPLLYRVKHQTRARIRPTPVVTLPAHQPKREELDHRRVRLVTQAVKEHDQEGEFVGAGCGERGLAAAAGDVDERIVIMRYTTAEQRASG